MRTHLIPVWEAQKAAGVIVEYSVINNTGQSSPEDWQFGIVLSYKHWAALDRLGPRNGPITLKHYGSAEARTAAGDARGKLRTQISSQLISSTTYARK